MNQRPNVLLITADDMNWDAVGAYGCPVEGTTPNIDRLAGDGIRFEHAHVTIAVCQPSRSALMTGRYPHHSGGEGFFRLRHEGIPILPEILRDGGYAVGILGKVSHSTPYASFTWDMCLDMDELGHGRNGELYALNARAFMKEAAGADRPFFLMANSHDPHRPFYGNDRAEWYDDTNGTPKALVPSRTFQADDVTPPGFLPDLPDVRTEIAEYYNSVRRCDDTVGMLLDALEASGAADNTIVLFLSDNGMAFPFSKTNCYLNSTRTPWIVRWPTVIEPGRVDRTHFISGIDLLPTLLDATGIDASVDGIDGTSFVPVLRGETQDGRDHVFTQFHQTAGKRNYPMRCVQNARFGYIFNPWSNGERIFKNESQAGRTMKAMQEAAASSEDIAARVELFLHRVPEELYDFEHDPDALNNLAGDPEHADQLDTLRAELRGWMERTGDPALDAFASPVDRAACETFMSRTAGELGGTG